MIEEKDCCDNCIEGIEPCCDEVLQEHIEQTIKTSGVTHDIDELASHLCCQRNLYIIHEVMDTLNKEELIKLRDQLRSYVPTGILHSELEQRFSRDIG